MILHLNDPSYPAIVSDQMETRLYSFNVNNNRKLSRIQVFILQK